MQVNTQIEAKERPFKTINHAAQVLQPGERVVIAEGVYREEIHPARGGTGPDAMISYEPAQDAKVVVKGSEVVTGWHPSEGWNFGIDPKTHKPVKAWELKLTPEMFPDGSLEPVETARAGGPVTTLDELLYQGLLDAALQGIPARSRQSVDRDERAHAAHSAGERR